VTLLVAPVKGLNVSQSKTESCGIPGEDRIALGAMAIPSASAKSSKAPYFLPTQLSE